MHPTLFSGDNLNRTQWFVLYVESARKLRGEVIHMKNKSRRKVQKEELAPRPKELSVTADVLHA